jgi:hypothetical protein
MDGGLDAQTIRLEGDIGRRAVGGRGIIVRSAGRECIGACIEEPFSGQFSSVKACFPMRGAAVLACELAGLPWPAINLSRLKITLPGLALWIFGRPHDPRPCKGVLRVTWRVRAGSMQV